MKASDLIVKALEAEGVEYIFAIPGEENLDMLESLKDSPIKLILTRHEQGAGFMAATYGRLTGKAGVCMATLGPGATNFFTCAAYAQLGGMPMMMITGQKPIKSSKQGQFQIVDIVAAMTPITKFSRQLVSGDVIPCNVREAFRLAQEERPGAVHLELPEDIASEETNAKIFAQSVVRRSIAEEKAIFRAVDKIENAKHPILLIGAAANRNMTSKMLTEFVEKTGIPFFTTQMGKGVVDERSPLFMGNAALSSGDFVHRAIESADLIINVGHDVVEKPPFFMVQGGREVIHVNHFSAKVDPVYFPQTEVVGDIANSIWQLKEKITPQSTWDFSYFMKVREALEVHLQEYTDNSSFPIMPQSLVATLRDIMPSDGIICLDNGVYKIWFARNYKAHKPNTVFLDNALATMGAGLPSAMAAKMVKPEVPVVAICGDGGFMMNSQEMETAVRLNLDLTVIILRDDAYGMIKWKQNNMGFGEHSLNFGNPDFVKYAESYGANGHRVNHQDDLYPTIEKCVNGKGVHLIDVPVNYTLNDQILNKEIKVKSKEV
ncbi:MAG: acetolactate synthase large subunit [Lentisphaeraceae bacterium]|nr:acetolactate synthase large subunit [Lentisphaeraceae bacterium]